MKFNAPHYFSRAESKAYRAILTEIERKSGSISDGQMDEAGDYVRAGTRLATLHMLLDTMSGDGQHRRQILSLNRAIDSTTGLAMRLADRLGLGARS